MKNDNMLIAENKERAELQIAAYTDKAKKINELLSYYNGLDVVGKITTKKEVFQFLNNPIEYFDNAILQDAGLSFRKSTPNPKKLAEIFNLNYDETIGRIMSTGLSKTIVEMLDYVNGAIIVKDEIKAQIFEQFKEYTENQAQINAVNLTRDLCNILNDYCTRFELDGAYSDNMHVISTKLGLSLQDGKLKENYPFIKQNLIYKSKKQNFENI